MRRTASSTACTTSGSRQGSRPACFATAPPWPSRCWPPPACWRSVHEAPATTTREDRMKTPDELVIPCALSVPRYLEEAYWWAYVRPRAVQLFEREWLVNLILFNNYVR